MVSVTYSTYVRRERPAGDFFGVRSDCTPVSVVAVGGAGDAGGGVLVAVVANTTSLVASARYDVSPHSERTGVEAVCAEQRGEHRQSESGSLCKQARAGGSVH